MNALAPAFLGALFRHHGGSADFLPRSAAFAEVLDPFGEQFIEATLQVGDGCDANRVRFGGVHYVVPNEVAVLSELTSCVSHTSTIVDEREVCQ